MPTPTGTCKQRGATRPVGGNTAITTCWRERRDRAKFRRIEAFGAALPDLRGQVSADLRRRGFPQPRVLAGTVRLLDRGALRIGSEEYQRRNGSHGLLTLRRDHLRISRGTL